MIKKKKIIKKSQKKKGDVGGSNGCDEECEGEYNQLNYEKSGNVETLFDYLF